MFKVVYRDNSGDDEVVIGTFDTVADATAFIRKLPGFHCLSGYGDEGYDILDTDGNLIKRFM